MHDAFLQSLLAYPRDDVSRQVYADWLEDQDDETARLQAEYLRLTVALAGPELAETQAEALRERLQQLAAQLLPDWLAVVSRIPIENCPRGEPVAAQEPPFRFLCNLNWQDLLPTADRTVRHCPECQQNVHYCGTIREARDHASQDHCVAIDPGVIRREGDVLLRRNEQDLPDGEILLGLMLPSWNFQDGAYSLDSTSQLREQRRYDRERPESDFDTVWDERDLAEIAEAEHYWGVIPIERLSTTGWCGISRFFVTDEDGLLTCYWGSLGVRVEVAELSVWADNGKGLWAAWVPRVLLPRSLRDWPTLERTVAEAPSTVQEPPLRQPDGTYVEPIGGVLHRYHQTRTTDSLGLSVWHWPSTSEAGVLRLFDAYQRLRNIAWRCSWLTGWFLRPNRSAIP